MLTAQLAVALLHVIGPQRAASPGMAVTTRIWAAQVVLASEASKIDPYLVVALIERESGWHEGYIGAKGELGLGQLMPHSDATRGYDHHPSVLLRVPVNIRLTVAWMAHVRSVCRTPDPALWLSVYKGIRKRGGRCVASPYSRWIVARAGALNALGARLVAAGAAVGRGEESEP